MVQKVLIVAALAAVLAASGCQRTSYYNGSQSQIGSALPALTPQPVGQVQSGALAPPTGGAYPGVYEPGPVGAQGQFPSAPSQPETPGGMGKIAVPVGAGPVSSSALVGSWKVSEGGVQCDMFLTLTNLGSGLRGGTRGCTSGLSAMKSWGISGNEVVLSDANGYAIARLYKTGEKTIEGSSSSGQQVVLSR